MSGKTLLESEGIDGSGGNGGKCRRILCLGDPKCENE